MVKKCTIYGRVWPKMSIFRPFLSTILNRILIDVHVFYKKFGCLESRLKLGSNLKNFLRKLNFRRNGEQEIKALLLTNTLKYLWNEKWHMDFLVISNPLDLLFPKKKPHITKMSSFYLYAQKLALLAKLHVNVTSQRGSNRSSKKN